MKRIILSAILLASLALADDQIIIPQDACFWRGQTYGQMLYCETGEIAVGSCGSGRAADCDTGKYVFLYFSDKVTIK